EVQVARAPSDLVALLEIALRFVQLLAVPARHAEVVVGDRATVLVIRRPERLEGAAVARDRFLEVALDIREAAKVLFDARPQRAAVPAQLQGPEEVLAGVGDGVRCQVDAAERVEGLAGAETGADVSSQGETPGA